MWFLSWKFIFCAALCLFTSPSFGVATPITTTTPPTYCCDFEYDTCSFVFPAGWYWSSTTPAPYVQNSDGNYIWTNSTNAVAYTANQIGVTPTTVFSFDYFLNSSSANLEVRFIPTSVPTGEVILDYLYYSSTWATGVIQCTSCCGVYPSCDGQLQVRLSSYEDGGHAGAIDNEAGDESCGGSVFPCCAFNDATMCGFTSSSSMDGYSWSSSAVSTPDPYITSPGSNFVYFVAVSPPSSMTVSLYSPIMSINTNVQFISTVITNIVPSSTNSYLQFYFQNSYTGISHLMGPGKTPSGQWQSCFFECPNCCDGAETCTGQVIVKAIVDATSSEVQFGIDIFEIDGECN